MASDYTVDPLTSSDGTAVDVEKTGTKGRVQTIDERVLEELQAISQTLNRILSVLELEFEQMSEEQYGSED